MKIFYFEKLFSDVFGDFHKFFDIVLEFLGYLLNTYAILLINSEKISDFQVGCRAILQNSAKFEFKKNRKNIEMR